MFSREDYDDWKIRMQAHLAAMDDEMWTVITEGPLKIMKPNLAVAVTNGEPRYLEKPRHEYTNDDRKKSNLDNVARDILYKTLDKDKNIALNDMVKEYMKLSHSFEEAKAENIILKSSSIESSSDELEDVYNLNIELSKLTAENDLLRNESSELKAEVERLTKEMSSWTQSARAFHKLQEIQKSAHDRTG
ncbi:hypothetical protein F511_27736 [Dorcoceras hygrometricum]|uniref:DUF4219 domain-containing protein n=1 Tax=Dorcoceras hygrometricum TaxID=472368 RepID=A0A2Z7DCP3_9LAMI|nr:hypothetical protein F511_27736 [Dorcoceras hygrometricum]